MSSTSALDRVKQALRQAGSQNQNGDDWTCPSHDDGSASLTVKYGKKPGRIVLKCGKCRADKVLEAIGLDESALFFDPDHEFVKPVGDWIDYVYTDEEGDNLFRVRRRPLANGKKETRQGSYTGRGWSGNLGDARRVLYQLPALQEAISKGWEIHLAEGESDAEALNDYFKSNKIKARATCHPMGAGKWQPQYTQTLAGAAAIVVWGDRDTPGYRCAAQRLSALQKAGIRARAALPIPDGKGADASDHLAAGYSPAEAKPVDEDELGRLAQETSAAADRAVLDEATAREAERLRVRRAATRLVDAEEAAAHVVVLPRQTLREALASPRPEESPVRVEGLHRIGYNSTITAKFKTGKTTLGGNLLRSLADGDPFLDKFEVTPPDGLIGLLNYELTDADMLDWLIDQDITRTDRIAVLNMRGQRFSLASERNQEELIKWCRDLGVEVLHLDPHRRAFAGFGSENSNDDVNRFTDTLDAVKSEAGVRDLFLYVHMGRMSSEVGAEHARGATALDDWTDQRWVLTKDEHEDRFMYADGRMDYVPEFRLAYQRSTRRLVAEDGNRRDNSTEKYRTAILNVLEVVEKEGAAVGALEMRLDINKKGALTPALGDLIREGLIVQRKRGNAKVNYLPQFAPSEAQ
jgi:hypothetical protein